MGKLAFIFPGQGAQYVGMGMQIAKEFASADGIFNQASETLGFDIKKMVFEGDAETLKITENTQPAILTTSIACMRPLIESGVTPDVAAGLSLGEYAAYVVSGAMLFRDAVALVRKRGRYMQEAVPLGVGTMAAIMGLEDEDVIDCCRSASVCGIVEPANFNCPGQVVIAGEVKAVEKAVELCNQKGAKKPMLLPVSAPFHCSMLKPAGEKLKKDLQEVNFNKMNLPVVVNATAEYVTDESLIKDLLVKQVSSPVLWRKSIGAMLAEGVDTFVEIGPGKVTSGFIKRISKDARTLNVEDSESLKKTLEELKNRN